MHGVKREEDVPEAILTERKNEEILQVARWKQLVQAINEAKASEEPSAIMAASAAVLLENPDYYTAWNARKRILPAVLKAAGNEAASVIRKELEFNVATIKRNPKSYFAWYHRRWLLERIIAADGDKSSFDPSHELKLCGKLLDLDPRNFHCWCYRRFLVDWFGTAKIPLDDEYAFAATKIFQNFSNYSAWHRRTELTPRVFENRPAELKAALQADLNLVKSAYFTEPADQSPWFYLRWLMEARVRANPAEVSTIREVEMANIDELLSLEPEAPLALLTWVQLAMEEGLYPERVKQHIELLCKVDPMHSAFYQKLLGRSDNK